jgi:hypothetical protein
MEVDPHYSSWLSVVDDCEFDLLSKLDYWERVDDSCLRRVEGDKVYVVLTEQEWIRHQEICRRVELECTSLDASTSTDQATLEMERLLAIEPKPKVVKVETPAEAEYRRLFVDPPNHPPSSRPPDSARNRFNPFGN